MGIKGMFLKQSDHLKQINQPTSVQPIPLNKVREYCKGANGIITLSIKYNDVKTLAKLNNGAGIAIATKNIWEAWGKLAMCKTRMKL